MWSNNVRIAYYSLINLRIKEVKERKREKEIKKIKKIKRKEKKRKCVPFINDPTSIRSHRSLRVTLAAAD